MVLATDKDRSHGGRPTTAAAATVNAMTNDLMNLPNQSTTRRQGAALTLIAAPPLLVAGTLISPVTETDHTAYLEVFAAHPDRVGIGALLFIVGHLLLAPALLSLARSLPGKVARMSGLVAAYGAMVFAGLGFVRLFEVAIATSVGPADGATVLEEFNAMPLVALAILPGVAGMMLGGLVFVIALWRCGFAPSWVVATFVAGQIGVMTGGDGTPIGAAGSAMLAVTFAALGWIWIAGPTASNALTRLRPHSNRNRPERLDA